MNSGFKQTEIGAVPCDWEVMRLGQLGTVVRGASPRPAGDKRYFDGSFISWLTVGSLTQISPNKIYVTQTAEKLTSDGATFSRRVPAGTLVMANSGAKTLGVTKVLAIDCCANDGVAALINQTKGDKRFLCHYLNSKITWLRTTVAAGNDQLNLNTSRISLIPVPVPIQGEQEAIANALSDADAYIEALEKILAKKRLVKKGVMQELLTGKRRLEGFTGNWKRETMGTICVSIQGGGTPSRSNPHFWNGGVPWMTVKDFTSFDPMTTIECISKEGLKNSSSKLIPAGTLIVATRMAVGKTAIYNVDVCINQDLKALSFRPDIQTQFVNYWFQHQQGMISNLGSGSTVMGLNVDELKKLEIRIPAIEEQQAISRIISDLENDIDVTEGKLKKIRRLKQGMMQELLTGRIRLV